MDSPENANKGYGWAKRFLECKTKILSEETGIKSIIVRPFNIYGDINGEEKVHKQSQC